MFDACKNAADFKAKVWKEEGEPEPLSEAETILEELDEQIFLSKGWHDLGYSKRQRTAEKCGRQNAIAIRDAAINTWAKSRCVADSDEEESASEKPKRRKRRRDAPQYLEAKCQVDTEVKKEELALHQQARIDLQQKRQDGNLNPRCFMNSSTHGNKQQQFDLQP